MADEVEDASGNVLKQFMYNPSTNEYFVALNYYGVRLTPVKDQLGLPLNLAVAHSGVLLFQNLTAVGTYEWPEIRKLSFKRKRFLIKLHEKV